MESKNINTPLTSRCDHKCIGD